MLTLNARLLQGTRETPLVFVFLIIKEIHVYYKNADNEDK